MTTKPDNSKRWRMQQTRATGQPGQKNPVCGKARDEQELRSECILIYDIRWFVNF